ncbi:hypothetical protein QYF36_023581 [Acer negundo]|nr:hypothetical protein QYF36_023581 [Acer negundo]
MSSHRDVATCSIHDGSGTPPPNRHIYLSLSRLGLKHVYVRPRTGIEPLLVSIHNWNQTTSGFDLDLELNQNWRHVFDVDMFRDCANCTKESISIALHDCSKSKQVKVWLKRCFLRYSDEDFIGVLDRISVAHTNETNLDDPSVSQRGFSMTTELAATTTKQPLMFKTAMLDAGDKGKRYGMAQCNRDISSADCDSCMADQLMSFRTTVGNVREWEIYGGRKLSSPSQAVAFGMMILTVSKLLLMF